MNFISNLVLPLIVLIVIFYSYKKINAYDTFIEGAKGSIDIIIKVFPTLLAMIFGINIFINSGIIDILSNKIPFETIMLAALRPISGSSSLALLNKIYIKYGPDSINGILGSIIQGSSDTTLYVISLYFGSVGIKKIRYALKAGILSDMIGVLISILVVMILF